MGNQLSCCRSVAPMDTQQSPRSVATMDTQEPPRPIPDNFVVPVDTQEPPRLIQIPSNSLSLMDSQELRRFSIPDYSVVAMEAQQPPCPIPISNNSVALMDTQQPPRLIPDNSVAPMDNQQRPRPIPDIKFRVLIIGRANSGKTSILQRVCDTTGSPVIYRGNKEVGGPTSFVCGSNSLSTRLNLTPQWRLVIVVHLFGCL